MISPFVNESLFNTIILEANTTFSEKSTSEKEQFLINKAREILAQEKDLHTACALAARVTSHGMHELEQQNLIKTYLQYSNSPLITALNTASAIREGLTRDQTLLLVIQEAKIRQLNAIAQMAFDQIQDPFIKNHASKKHGFNMTCA